MAWWKSGVLYQIYPRSFADSNGDGQGDLRGVISRLDHLAWLGVDGIWLSPITVSPQADWGYDVADYCDVDPDFGTLADLDELVAAAGERGIRVLLDLVPNHTSDQHPWFKEARASRMSPRRDWYVWADAPNNWVSAFGGPAWTLDQTTGQYYLHNFLPEQPDLDWWNPALRDAFDDILTFWFERGIAGFRIDVCTMIIKDAELRDNPPATDEDPLVHRLFGQRPVFNSNRPEVHDVFRRWRRIADAHDAVLVGETAVEDLEILMRFYGDGGDQLHLAFNFPFIESPFDAKALSDVADASYGRLPAGAWPVWTGSNHDVSRLASRWAGGDPRKIRLALLMLLTLWGTPVLYQGDEIGLVDGEITREDLKDPVGTRFWPAYRGRDPERTPMPWSSSGSEWVNPWLPLRDPASCNVADQREDPVSILAYTRDLIELRRRTPDLHSGAYRRLASPERTWVWQRGETTVVALNFSDERVTIDGVGDVAAWEGRVVLS